MKKIIINGDPNDKGQDFLVAKVNDQNTLIFYQWNGVTQKESVVFLSAEEIQKLKEFLE